MWPVFVALTKSLAFWWIVYTQTDCVWVEPTITHHFRRSEQNLDKPIYNTGFCSLNSTYSSWRLHRRNLFCSCTFFLMLTIEGLNFLCCACRKRLTTVFTKYTMNFFNSRACLMRYWTRFSRESKDSYSLFRCSTSQCLFLSYLLRQPVQVTGFCLHFFRYMIHYYRTQIY